MMSAPDLYQYERQIAAGRGFSLFCGTDEAGRGPLAGPVCAGAVWLDGQHFEFLNDSKKVTEKRRDKLFDQITANCPHAICWVDVAGIERLNIKNAALTAMRQAVRQLAEQIKLDGVLVDGDAASGFSLPAMPVIGGDGKCASIAAASILAKVSRDRYMTELDTKYPGYGFARHKGYPTKEHYAAIDLLGVCPEHRMLFLRKHFAAKQENAGAEGERIAARYLVKQGYEILDRNYHGQFGELDLVAKKDGCLIFAEVKTRADDHFARAAEFVDTRKCERLRKTAYAWIEQYGGGEQLRFDVIEIYAPGELKEQVNHIVNAF